MLRVYAIIVVLIGTVQAVPFKNVGWNALLRAEYLFPDQENEIRIYGRSAISKETILNELNTVLNRPNVLQNVFNRFLQSYDKKGSDTQYRMDTFKKELLEIASHNYDAEQGIHSWFMGVNPYADMNVTEFLAHVTTKDLKFTVKPRLESRIAKLRSTKKVRLNWDKLGFVTSVKDQGQCGSCVAFAVSSTFESAVAISQKQAPVDLSAQQILDCAAPDRNICGTGMSVRIAYDYVLKNGLQTWSSYPYEKMQRQCRVKTDKSKEQIYGWGYVASTEIDLKNAVAKTPVTITLHASGSFKNYKSGVFSGPCEGQHNHAVTVVGFDVVQGKPTWIIKNSWGRDWGQNGFIYLERDASNLCGVADNVITPILS